MENNAQRFLNAFSQIETVFKSWNKSTKTSSFSNYVHRYSKNHSLIKQYRDDLLEYSQLRNAIVHDRAGQNEIIAQPHDEVVKEIERIALILMHPPLIEDIKFDKLITCQLDDSLLDTLSLMTRKGYPQLPILSGVMVQGVLTNQMIMAYMLDHIEGKIIDLEGVKVKDIFNSVKKADYILIHDTNEVLSVVEEFANYQQRGKILSAIIVLNDESLKKGPIGILTSRDIPRLLSKITHN